MKPEDSLPHSQQPSACSCPEPDRHSPRPPLQNPNLLKIKQLNNNWHISINAAWCLVQDTLFIQYKHEKYDITHFY